MNEWITTNPCNVSADTCANALNGPHEWNNRVYRLFLARSCLRSSGVQQVWRVWHPLGTRLRAFGLVAERQWVRLRGALPIASWPTLLQTARPGVSLHHACRLRESWPNPR